MFNSIFRQQLRDSHVSLRGLKETLLWQLGALNLLTQWLCELHRPPLLGLHYSRSSNEKTKECFFIQYMKGIYLNTDLTGKAIKNNILIEKIESFEKSWSSTLTRVSNDYLKSRNSTLLKFVVCKMSEINSVKGWDWTVAVKAVQRLHFCDCWIRCLF